MKRILIRNRYLAFTDILLCFVSYFLVFLVIYSLNTTFEKFSDSLPIAAVTAVLNVLILMLFDVYHTDWVHAGTSEYLKLIIASSIAGLASVFIALATPFLNISFKINVTANICTMICVSLFRFALRILFNIRHQKYGSGEKRTLIIGAGALAISLLRDIHQNENLNYKIVGLIDDNEDKKNINMYGAKVIGNRKDIARICDSLAVEEIIFAIYDIPQKDKTEILNICNQTGRKIRILQGMAAHLTDKRTETIFRNIDIEDLLERDPIELDNQLIKKDIMDKVVMVTGAGGSIGSELCRQIISFKPQRLILLDIYENTTFDIQNELKANYPDQCITTLIASVRDKERLNFIFEKYKPDIVFHAAAHKHVPLMEDNPCEAIKNNVLGTYNVALCSKVYDAKKFILISTDKAVNPTNVMGASKRVCEMIIQTLQQGSKTEFVAVRFGNVLGSNGSVIPTFKKQIENGGPVTVTHPEITRFFMTIPEATQLVLQAAAYAKGGEIFVLDMGQPVKIYDLAKKMIKLSGAEPDKDIKIVFTGLRQGEKLYEELLMSEEGLEKTAHSKIFIGKPGNLTIEELEYKIEKLTSVIGDDNEKIKEIVAEVVPTYSVYKEEVV